MLQSMKVPFFGLLICLCLSAMLMQAKSPQEAATSHPVVAAASAEPVDAPACDSGQSISGVMRVEEFFVEQGRTVYVDADLELRASGPVVIAGELVARTAGNGDETPNAPNIELISEMLVFIDGRVVGGSGSSFDEFPEEVSEEVSLGRTGGRGTSVYLEAPLIINNGSVMGGHGGDSGPGAIGGPGGAVYCVGHTARTRVDPRALGIRGGNGGAGGRGIGVHVPAGQGGSGGDAHHLLGLHEKQANVETPLFQVARNIEAMYSLGSKRVASNESPSAPPPTGARTRLFPTTAPQAGGGGTQPNCTEPDQPARPPKSGGGQAGVGGNGANGTPSSPDGKTGGKGGTAANVTAADGTDGTDAKTCCLPERRPGVKGGEGGDAGKALGNKGGLGGPGGDAYKDIYGEWQGYGGNGGQGGDPGTVTRGEGGKGGRGADGDPTGGEGGAGGTVGMGHMKSEGGLGSTSPGDGIEPGENGPDNQGQYFPEGGQNGAIGAPGDPCPPEDD